MYNLNFYGAVIIATAAASSAAIFTNLKIGWWCLLFRYVTKMATIVGEMCPAFHTQLFDRYEHTIRVLIMQCMLP